MASVPTLFGRDAALAELTAALDGTLAGRGGLALIAGEPGIGKTTLAEHVCRLAHERGARVAWGRALPDGSSPAFWPWHEALEELGRDGPTIAAGDLRAEEAQAIAFRELAARLRSIAANGPVVIALDDLHAADHASLGFLRYVARLLRSMKVLVLGTYRDVEAERRDEATAAIAASCRDAIAMFALERLAASEVDDLVCALGAHPAQSERIFALTQGNPLFVHEVVRLLGQRAREPATSAEVPLSLGVRGVLRERLALCSDAARDALGVLAVLGTQASASDVARLARSDVEAALREATAIGVLVERRSGVVAFSHALYREVVVRDLPASRRHALHAAAGALLRDRGEAAAPEVAGHLLRAGPDAIGEAIAAAVAAAQSLAHRAAHRDAEELLEHAVTTLDDAGASSAQRATLLVALARAKIAAGRGDEGRALSIEAADMARKVGDAALLAQAALAYGSEIRPANVDPTMIALLREAKGALPAEDSALRARVLARLAAAEQPASDPMVPVAAARDAIAMARRVADEPTLLAVLHFAMSAMMDYADPKERGLLNAETFELALRAGDRPTQLRALLRLVFDAFEAGDVPAARGHRARYAEIARTIEHPRYTWPDVSLQALEETLAGRFDDADAAIDRAEAMARGAGDPAIDLACTIQRYFVGRIAERRDAMASAVSAMEALLDRFGMPAVMRKVVRAGAAARGGDPAECRGLLEGYAPTPWIDNDVVWTSLVAEAAAVAGDVPLAEHMLAVITPQRTRSFTYGIAGMSWEGTLRRHVGLLSAILGRDDEADAMLAEETRVLREAGANGMLARALYEHAAVLAASANEARRRRAIPLRTEARELATRLGQTALISQFDRIAEDRLTPTKSSSSEIAPSRAISLERDGETWHLRSGDRDVRFKDSRGMQLLATLIARPDEEVHVLELAGAAGSDDRDLGAMLDPRAKAEYAARIAELREEIEEASERGDVGRAERMQDELEAIREQLAGAVGLGGRDRKVGAASERARVAVQRRVREAIKRVSEHAPEIGAYLDRCVRTGTYCSFRPLA